MLRTSPLFHLAGQPPDQPKDNNKGKYKDKDDNKDKTIYRTLKLPRTTHLSSLFLPAPIVYFYGESVSLSVTKADCHLSN